MTRAYLTYKLCVLRPTVAKKTLILSKKFRAKNTSPDTVRCAPSFHKPLAVI